MNHLKDQINLSGALPGLFLFLKDMRFRYCLPTADSFLGLPLLPFLHFPHFSQGHTAHYAEILLGSGQAVFPSVFSFCLSLFSQTERWALPVSPPTGEAATHALAPIASLRYVRTG